MGGNSALVINPACLKHCRSIRSGIRADLAGVHRGERARRSARSSGQVVAELVALAKAQPGKPLLCHAGVGTSQHLARELFK